MSVLDTTPLFHLKTTGVLQIAPALRVAELGSTVKDEAPRHRLDEVLQTLENSLIRHLCAVVAELEPLHDPLAFFGVADVDLTVEGELPDCAVSDP